MNNSEENGGEQNSFHFGSSINGSENGEKDEEEVDTEVRTRRKIKRFFWSASHDLRAPIRRLLTYTDFLKEDLEEGSVDKAEEDLCFLEEAAFQLQSHLEGLLRLFQSDYGGLHIKNVSPGQCIDRVLRTLSDEMLEPFEIQKASFPEVRADRQLLTLVYQNLVENVLRHVEKESPVLEFTCEPRRDACVLGVMDNGKGIRKEKAEAIFEPFESEEEQVIDHPGGAGLGLAICQEIVRKHDGEIWVESPRNRGCHFRFTMPTSDG